MLYTVISLDDIFYSGSFKCNNSVRSSNPYDYIGKGYYLDNASMFGGKSYVSFNSNFSGNSTGAIVDFSDIGKRTQRNIP